MLYGVEKIILGKFILHAVSLSFYVISALYVLLGTENKPVDRLKKLTSIYFHFVPYTVVLQFAHACIIFDSTCITQVRDI